MKIGLMMLLWVMGFLWEQLFLAQESMNILGWPIKEFIKKYALGTYSGGGWLHGWAKSRFLVSILLFFSSFCVGIFSLFFFHGCCVSEASLDSHSLIIFFHGLCGHI